MPRGLTEYRSINPSRLDLYMLHRLSFTELATVRSLTIRSKNIRNRQGLCGRNTESREMDIFLNAGIVLGLSAGFSPGPLTTLVISQALQFGFREGLKVALVPFITDAPIIILSLVVLRRLSESQGILGLISIFGGIFLVYLAYLSFRTTGLDVDVRQNAPRSLGKGTLTNFLSPNPYLFWMSVGAPYTLDAWGHGPWMAAVFLVAFYTCLIGAKMAIAVVAARSRRLLTGAVYGYVMRILGGLLLVLAFLLFRDGVVLLNTWLR